MVDTWRIVALDSSGNVSGFVSAWESLTAVLRWRSPATWALEADAANVAMLSEGSRVAIYRRPAGLPEQLVTAGYVDRILVESDKDGDRAVASGVDVAGALAWRLVYPTPENPAGTQTTVARWSDGGPGSFLIHRLITRNLGMGASRLRMFADSRVGTAVRGNPQNGGAGWSDTSDGGVTWAGQTATIPSGSSARLRMTDAIDLSTTDMATAVANVSVSGSATLAVVGYFNATAAGAAPGQAGVVTETSVIHRAADIGSAVTLWLAEVFRTRNAGKSWVRLEVGVQASGATRTATFNAGGGVYTQAMAGATVAVSSRFANLAEEVEGLCRAGGVRLLGEFTEGRPKITASAPTDKTASVRFSTQLGNVRSWRTVKGAPRATRVAVAGAGEGEARIIRERANTAVEASWGRRVETFRDARDVDAAETATLDQRGDELLADQAQTAGFSVDVIDTPGMAFGSGYLVGDKVAVNIRGAVVDDFIAEVEIRADKNGTQIQPIVASAQLADSEPDIYARVSRVQNAINGLERRR